MGLTESQVEAIGITQRVAGSVSLLVIAFVLLTYIFLRQSFNKSINRLIFYATWSNIGTSIASLIAQDGLASGKSVLCQFQGFCVEMFFHVDVLWAACMALNVYLVIFRGWDVKRLHSLDIFYLLFCYGFAFVPAFSYLFVETKSRGRVYGDAGIWCWVTEEWDLLRIATSYGVIWATLLFSFTVYAFAGYIIWKKYDQLKCLLNPFRANPFEVVTEVTITHETNQGESHNESCSLTELNPAQYKVNVDAEPKPKHAHNLAVGNVIRQVAENEVNAEAWLYARIAFLFGLAMLITWVPASINRVYTLIDPDYVNFGMSYTASFVLSLHGFWNGIVYIISSQTACKQLCRQAFARKSSTKAEERPPPNINDGYWY